MPRVIVIALAGWALFMGAVGLSGCQTTGRGDDPSKMVPAARIPFVPSVQKVSLQSGESRYPNLFTGASYAVWSGPDLQHAMMVAPAMEEQAMMEEKMEEKAMTEAPSGEMVEGAEEAPEDVVPDKVKMMVAMNQAAGTPITITCYLESAFSDMSIAYDAVSLRGIQFHLEYPDGTQVLPVQKTLDSELSEEPMGALRRYGRKLTLHFPGRQILVDNPAVVSNPKGVRLVLNGHGSEFFFEWRPRPDTRATAKPARWDEDALRMTRAFAQDATARIKRIAHEFD